MLQKIGVNFGDKNSKVSLLKSPEKAVNSTYVQNSIKSGSVSLKPLQNDTVSFTGSGKNQGVTERQIILEKNYNQGTKDLIKRAEKLAGEYGHAEIDKYHLQTASLESYRQYLSDLDSGAKTYDTGKYSSSVDFYTMVSSDKVLKIQSERDKVKPVIEQEIKSLHEVLAQQPKTAVDNTVKRGLPIVENIVDGVFDKYAGALAEADAKSVPVDEGMFLESLFSSEEALDKNRFRKFCMKMADSVMRDSRPQSEKIPLTAYSEKAKNVFRNLSLGTNMLVTYDKNTKPSHFVDTFTHLFETKDPSLNGIIKENPDIIVLNENVQEEYLVDKVRDVLKQKDKKSIIVFDADALWANSISPELKELGSFTVSYDETLENVFKNPPKNLQFVITQERNAYLDFINNDSREVFQNFGEVSMPILSNEQAKKAFREQPNLLNKLDTTFSKQAIDEVVDATVMLNGNYPEKAQKIMKKIASYYVGHKEISATDVKKYVAEAKDIFKQNEDNSSIDVVFDTKVKLDNIIGKEATKKEAESIIRQIKQKRLGTKGAIIYSQDGSVGSGRKYTAKAIAGETKSPYVEINALDFGTKDVDLFGGGALSPEKSVRKLFSMITTQAEVSPSKSAVLFIENFEYFSLGDMVSEYHQKAMSQLLREMDKATKNGMNILVLGSVGDPQAIGDSTLKSLKFIDRIEVESPAFNIDARKEILTHAIKKQGVKLAGETDAAKAPLVHLMSEITDGFPFVYLMSLTDKVKTVAFERNHKNVLEEDIVEGYMQLTTGRPASGAISKHSKDIVTAHECGHAFNEEYMYELAKKSKTPWRLGDKVAFITLDPRSNYSGAVYNKSGGNEEHSFEKMFSNIVCDFGGHSAEKQFYNIDGSWGITSDMEVATANAEQSVGIMGQGRNFGKKSLNGMSMPPSGAAIERFEKDVDAILKNGELASDLITKFSAGFNDEFTKKYADLVGTGKCLVKGDQYREEIKAWLDKQPKSVLAQKEELDKTILKIIEAAKQGKVFKINSFSVSRSIKKLYELKSFRF